METRAHGPSFADESQHLGSEIHRPVDKKLSLDLKSDRCEM